MHGYADPDFNQLLAKAGLTMSYGEADNETNKVKNTPWSGIKTKKHANGLEIISVEKNSPAWQAGLTLGDIIVAVDGLRMADNDLTKRIKNFKAQDKVSVSFFRRDQLMDKTVTLGSVPASKLKIVPMKNVTKQQKAFFKMWSGLAFPSTDNK